MPEANPTRDYMDRTTQLQPARATKLLTKVNGEERSVKHTGSGLNKDGATGTLAKDTVTQLRDAQDEFAD